MGYAEVISALSLLGGIILVYAQLKADLAKHAVLLEAMKEAHEVFRLEMTAVVDSLVRGKADKDVLLRFKDDLTAQITQNRRDSKDQFDELKKTLDDIVKYLRK